MYLALAVETLYLGFKNDGEKTSILINCIKRTVDDDTLTEIIKVK